MVPTLFCHRLVWLVLTSLTADLALSREMLTRKDARSVPGYNSGLGRFVDRDRVMALEFDTLTPAKASMAADDGNNVEEWGTDLQLNLGSFALGSEFWFGNYKKVTPSEGGASIDDGEFYKMTYNRYQVMLTRYSSPHRMHGWYAEGGYSYTRIDAETALIDGEAELSDEAIYRVTDEQRHGPCVGAGRRFGFLRNRGILNVGVAYTRNLSREINTSNPEDTNPRRYDSILANAGDKRLAPKDFPEMRLGLGLMF